MSKFKCEYKFTVRFGTESHSWSCIGRHAALELNIRGPYENGNYSGGLEMHYRQPPSYMNDEVPSHENCHLIGGPCWHDGTSLYVQEVLEPYWQDLRGTPNEHKKMFAVLENEYRKRVEDVDNA